MVTQASNPAFPVLKRLGWAGQRNIDLEDNTGSVASHSQERKRENNKGIKWKKKTIEK